MSVDLNENMTSEEISAYADSVAKEVAQERQGERKSDAEIVVDTSAESDSGSDAVPTDSQDDDVSAEIDDQAIDGQSEGSGDDLAASEWMTDDVKAEAATYGISESDLSEFASREELDRALRLFDKTALEAGRKAMVEGEEKGPARDEKGKFAKKDDSELSEEEGTRKEGRYQVSLDAQDYDEDLIGELNRLSDHYESRIDALEAFFMEAKANAEEQQFDNLVESLGHADLFGKTGSETAEELQRRKDLHVAVKAQMIGLEQLGRPAELNDQLVGRVANMVFADELGKKRLKERTRKISKQNNSRLGGSPVKPTPPSDNPRDEADRLYKELERA